MKTKILILIICVCPLFKIQAQTQEWEWACSLVGEQLCKVCTQGADTVYVVGENGLIAQSTDKGLTWNKRHCLNDEIFNDIIFCNHEVGFIVGSSGTILRTKDAGFSWEQMTYGTNQYINAMAAFDLNNIWAVGMDGLIMHSTDVGETWITKPLVSDHYHSLYDIKCKGKRGYVVGGKERCGIVLITEDGGTTWEEQIVTESGPILSLSITDNKVYAIRYFGGGGCGIIFTEDNTNWHDLSFQNSPPVYGFITAIYFQDGQKGFIGTYGSSTREASIYKTTDGGNIWEKVYSKYFQGGNSIRNNIAFSLNNEFGYCTWEYDLTRTPYTNEFDNCTVGMNVIKSENPVLIFNQDGNELQINSDSKMIDRVELIRIDGIKIIQREEQTKMLNVNVSTLPKGIYLVNVLFSDNRIFVSKWIKH